MDTTPTVPEVVVPKQRWKKILTHTVFWWLLLTMLYVLIYMHYQTTRSNYQSVISNTSAGIVYNAPFHPDILTRIGQFIGLFVPIGPQNLILIMAYGIPLIVLGIGIASYELIAVRYNLSNLTKIIGALLLLFIVTFVLDILLLHRYCSWMIFTSSNYYACNLKVLFP